MIEVQSISDLDEVTELQNQVIALTTENEELNDKLSELEHELAQLTADIGNLTAIIDELKDGLEDILRISSKLV